MKRDLQNTIRQSDIECMALSIRQSRGLYENVAFPRTGEEFPFSCFRQTLFRPPGESAAGTMSWMPGY